MDTMITEAATPAGVDIKHSFVYEEGPVTSFNVNVALHKKKRIMYERAV